MPKLLVVDDDQDLLNKLKSWFVSENYMVETATFGEDAIQLAQNTEYDVIVLDWDLPDIKGIAVCRKLRTLGNKTPVLFLTGHDQVQYKEEGLDAGGDDFVVKPFEPRELAARLRSLIRRSSNAISNELLLGGVTYDAGTRTVKFRSKQGRLTAREGALFEFFLRHPDRLFLARDLLAKVWPTDSYSTEDSVRTCLKTLRQRLSEVGLNGLVKTVQGAGYIIESGWSEE